VLAAPPASAAPMIQTLGHDPARELLRYLAGEENRLFFGNWELAQLVIGVALTFVLFSGVRRPLLAGLAAVLVLLTGTQHFMITAQMLSLGREIDFAASGTASAARDSFFRLHALYGGIEVLKLALVLVLSGFLLARRQGSLESRLKVDSVDYAHHGHVDG
jgi:hypothetical protein